MDLDLQKALINQLFAETLERAQAARLGFVAALDVDKRLWDQATGEPATAKVRAAFRELLGAIAADGVLTDGERRQIMGFLEANGLTMEPPATKARPVDLDGIQLPDF